MANITRQTQIVDDTAYEAATKAGAERMRREPLATAARYSAGRVYVELNNGVHFSFAAENAEGLAGAKAADLRTIEILGGGTALHWPALDADFGVLHLLNGVFGSRRWMAAVLGAAGGRATTEKKIAAARANGKLGGRPPGRRGAAT